MCCWRSRLAGGWRPSIFLAYRAVWAGDAGLEQVVGFVEMFAGDCGDGGGVSETTIQRFVEAGGTGFQLPRRPLYGVLHEAIYCYEPGVVSDWAAQRVGRVEGGS